MSAATRQLRLSSGNGPVYRTVLCTPPRDAEISEIPIIDVSGLFSTKDADHEAVAAAVRAAAKNIGFFYIKNHGIPPAVTEDAYKACLDFFRQPAEIKAAADATRSRFLNGYKGPQTQRINPSESIDVRETFSWRYDPVLDPAVPDDAAIPPHIAAHLCSEDFQWQATTNLPHFRDAVVDYWQACLKLARHLVRAFALSLDLPENALDAKFSHPDASLALNYYPPIAAGADAPAATDTTTDTPEEVSIGSHTDFQLFTVLWQDVVGGLQVLNRQGQWIYARPIPGTLVVNIGDYLQRITNDRYVSTVHRVQNRSGLERVSMPFFFGFNLNETCGVLDSCVSPGEVKKYAEISCQDWVRRRAEAMHDTVGDVTDTVKVK